jgi:hypothetical protein
MPRVAAFALAAVAAFSARPAGDAGADPNAGATLVRNNGCSGCHGATFGGGIGPALGGIEKRLSAAQIAAAIRTPKAPMPNFGFSESQIADIVAYLSGLDGGAAGTAPVATLTPPTPGSHATLTVRFSGTPPASVVAVASMAMGSSSMSAPAVHLHATSDPLVWTGPVSFSMAGPWTIDITYDGKHVTLPVNVAGGT